jgi:hypothetical protein
VFIMKLRSLSCIAPLLGLALLVATPACGDSSSEDTSGSSGSGETGSGLACADEWVEKPDLMSSEDKTAHWGTACTSDSDCAHLGEGAVCFPDALGVFELPGGACSKYCDLPDTATTVVPDDPQCDPDGGVACMGAKDIFSACLPTCESDSECGREGYACINMPVISAPTDPTFCLMNPDACCLDPTMCT